MVKPNLFIVGEPKSGTTALCFLLSQHPDIFISEPKEPNFFSKDLIKESDKFHGKKRFFEYRTEEDYLKLFKNCNCKICGEGSTTYLYSKVAAHEIKKFNPEAKIIIMIRNIVDFLHSLHSEYLSLGDENVEDFKTALDLEELRKQGKHLPKRVLFPSYLFYSERSKFTEHIKRFYEFFDKKQIKIIIQEEFKENNAVIYKEVLEFLGVDSGFTPEFKIINPNKKVRFRKLKNLLESPLFWKVPKSITPNKVYELMKKIFYGVMFKKEPRYKMDENLRLELMKKYKPEVVKLSKMLNRDLVSLWGYDKIS